MGPAEPPPAPPPGRRAAAGEGAEVTLRKPRQAAYGPDGVRPRANSFPFVARCVGHRAGTHAPRRSHVPHDRLGLSR